MSSTSQAAPDFTRPASLERYYPAVVVGIAIVTYIATLRFGFVYDDHQQIVNDPLIRSWHNLPLLFKTDVWRFWHPAMVGNYWRPLFMVWLLLNYKTFGLAAMGWHLSSVLVHALAACLCYQFTKRITQNSFVALATGVVFAVHPVHLETVAWVSGVTDSLMAVFFLGALLCFVRGWECEQAGAGWFVTSSLLFACALMCKETAAVLPLVALCYVLLFRHPRPRGYGRFVLPLMFYTGIVVLYWVARRSALQGVGHSEFEIGVGSLLLTWPSLLWFYIGHLCWPVGLSILYDRLPVLHPDGRHFWLPLLAIAAVIIVVTAVLRRRDRRPAAFALFLFALPLAPAFILPALFPTDYGHDRYLYLPCLGFAMLVGILIERTLSTKKSARWLALGALVVGFSVATSAQIIYWANDLLLFDRATEIAPGNLNAYNNLANALIDRGRTDEAVSIFRQMLQADPNNWQALYNLGLHYFMTNNYPEAEGYLRRASAVHATDADTFALLADVLNHQEKYADSEAAIRRALVLRPDKAGYRKVLAIALDGQGRRSEALEQIRAEVNAHPDEYEAVMFLKSLQSRHQ